MSDNFGLIDPAEIIPPNLVFVKFPQIVYLVLRLPLLKYLRLYPKMDKFFDRAKKDLTKRVGQDENIRTNPDS
ncbi:hypothetical protein M1N84_04555 [Dehalococcoidia bacterium]|nr:hypothetical protein [Dehalococcoidia bacterium]